MSPPVGAARRWLRHLGGPMNALARRALTVVAATSLATIGLAAAGPPTAHADGPTTFTNPSAISLPVAGDPDQAGNGSPYPSNNTLSGMTGSINKVTATINNFTHSSASDVDLLLVAPTGANLELMSDLNNNGFVNASNATVTFDDAASGTIPATTNLSSGTYKPTNFGVNDDSFPAPAPSISSNTTFAAAFTGLNPNGTWALYSVDDSTGDVGAING